MISRNNSCRISPTLVVSKRVRLHRHGSIDRLLALYQPGTRHLAVPGAVTSPRSCHPKGRSSTGPGAITRPYMDPSPIREPSTGSGDVTWPYLDPSPVWGPSAGPGLVTLLHLGPSPVRGPSAGPIAVARPLLGSSSIRSRQAVWDPSPSRYQSHYPSTGRVYIRDPSPDRYQAHYPYGGLYGDREPSPVPSQPRFRDALPIAGFFPELRLLQFPVTSSF